MPAEYRIRPVGRPKVERASNGLRRITRRYVVQGEAVTSGNIESHVFLPFGTQDEEYKGLTQDLSAGGAPGSYSEDLGDSDTSAYLVAQSVEPSEEVTQAFLTRVYQELESTPVPVQVDLDDVIINDDGRVSIKRKFIVKNNFTNDGTTLKPGTITPYTAHLDSSRVGSEYITFEGKKCYIGGIESDEHEVFTEYTETFFEDAILSLTVEYRNGKNPDHNLEIRTIRAISGAASLAEPSSGEGPGDGRWFLVSKREGPGSATFGQGGKPIHTKVWAKGEGIVSDQRQIKHNGALEVASVRSLNIAPTEEDVGVKSFHNGAKFYKISESESKQSGYHAISTTFAAGFGMISETTSKKGNFEMRRQTWVTEPGTDPQLVADSSGLDNVLRSSLSKRDGYEVHTISGTTQESGIITTSRQIRHNGDLEIVRIVKIGSEPVSSDVESVYGTAGNGSPWTLIAESKNESDQYTVYSATFAAGKGTIRTASSSNGKVVTNSYTTLDTPVPGGASASSEEDRDGYVVRTYKTYSIDGGAAEDKSKRWLNKYVYSESKKNMASSPPSPLAGAANDVSGSYAQAAPGSIYRTDDTDITVDSSGVINSNIRYVPSGNYFQITKTVASENGFTLEEARSESWWPENSVLLGSATSYSRGWQRDQYTWAVLASDSVTMSSVTAIPWTLPGIYKVVQPTSVSQVPPVRIQLPVTKTTKLTTSEPSIDSSLMLRRPWIYVNIGIHFKGKTDPYLTDAYKYNWVYNLRRSTDSGDEQVFHGKSTFSKEFTLDGWTESDYNSAVENGVTLSHDYEVAMTDGTTTIYKEEKVQANANTLTVDSSSV